MNAHLHHAPDDCPVCGDKLITIRKGCLTCGSELAGEFASCEFCALESAELEMLKVFLASRGNLRDVEKHLGVSYPTARARLDAVLAKLDLAPAESGGADPAEPGPAARERTEPMSPREQILKRVEAGEITADVAAQLIAGLG